MVSAWSTKNGIVLGQTQVNAKSNEITAIPELIDLLDIKDAVVTIDAMGCQREIAEKIITKKADYVLALKKNQQSFYERVEMAFARGLECNFKDMNYSFYQDDTMSHGRSEGRNYYKIQDVEFLKRNKDWKGLSAIGMVESITMRSGKLQVEKRYYITSLSGSAEEMGNAIRKHWSIENNLHWKLDVQFADDSSRKQEKNSASNFSMIKRMALNMLKKSGPANWRTNKKRMMATFDDKFLMGILTNAA
jgi:predicted transposase YbfD/YdcC